MLIKIWKFFLYAIIYSCFRVFYYVFNVNFYISLLQKLSRYSFTMWFIVSSRGIHIAFRAWSLYSKSIIPIPPSKISPINVYLFILSVLFHKKLHIKRFISFINFLSGSSKIFAMYNSLDKASVFIIVYTFSKNRQFSSCPWFNQMINHHPVFIIAF